MRSPVAQPVPPDTQQQRGQEDEEGEGEDEDNQEGNPMQSMGQYGRDGYTLTKPMTTTIRAQPTDYIPGPKSTMEIKQKNADGTENKYWEQERFYRITASNVLTIFGLYERHCPSIARFLSDRRDEMAVDYWNLHGKCPPYMTEGVMKKLVQGNRGLGPPGRPDGYEFQQVIRRLRKEEHYRKDKTPAMAAGNKYEDSVREVFQDACGLQLHESGFIINHAIGYRGGSADFWMLDGLEIGEIKCQTGKASWDKLFSDLEMARGFDVMYMGQIFDNLIHSLYARFINVVVSRNKETVWTRFPKDARVCYLHNKLIGWWYHEVVLEKKYMMATAEDWMSEECPLKADFEEYITLLQTLSLLHPFKLIRNRRGEILPIVSVNRPAEWVDRNIRRRVDPFGPLATLHTLRFGDEELKRKRPRPYTEGLPARLLPRHSPSPSHAGASAGVGLGMDVAVKEEEPRDEFGDLEDMPMGGLDSPEGASATAAAGPSVLSTMQRQQPMGDITFIYINQMKDGKKDWQGFSSLGDDGRDVHGTLRSVLVQDLRSPKKRTLLTDVKVIRSQLREAPLQALTEIILWMDRTGVLVDAYNLVQKWTLIYLPPPDVPGGYFLTAASLPSPVVAGDGAPSPPSTGTVPRNPSLVIRG